MLESVESANSECARPPQLFVSGQYCEEGLEPRRLLIDELKGAQWIIRASPFISVVMPVYNGAATIGSALDSLLAQDYPRDRYEVIVVNDGSTDDTAKIVAQRHNVRYMEQPRNMGIPSALNAGLEAARGEIFATIDDDCQAAPDYLSQLALGYLRLDKPLGVGGVIVKRAPGRGCRPSG